MSTESLSLLHYLFMQPLFLRLIVLVAVATIFGLLYFLAERLQPANSSKTFAIVKKHNSRRSAMTLSGQQQ